MAKSPRKECAPVGGKRVTASKNYPQPRPTTFKRAGKTATHYNFQPAGKRTGLTPSRRFSIVDLNSDDDDDDDVVEPTPVVSKRLPSKTAATKRYPKKTARKSNKHHILQLAEDVEEDMDEDDFIGEDEDAEVSDALSVLIDFLFMNAAASRRKSVALQYELDDDLSDDLSLDLDVDFVKLQQQHKAKRHSPKKAGRPLVPKKFELAIASSDSELELSDVPSGELLTTSIEPPKFGRRKSEAALPDDINFAFDFDTAPELPETLALPLLDEDLGEDLGEDLPTPEIPVLPSSLDIVDFDLPVPKITDVGLDDEYEFDDNQLLATLHAEDDLLDLPLVSEARSRNNSIDSLEPDEAQFLKEEEKYLVNEFEENGFDGDDESEDEVLDNELIDFDDDYLPNPHEKITSRLKDALDEDEDDVYMWNYFFSTKLDEEDEAARARATSFENAIATLDDEGDVVVDTGYNSSESTDVDESLPRTGAAASSGSLAKEVLSSTTTDYRPPVLGTWVTVDSKPFGIIDGLLTRTLDGLEPRKLRKLVVLVAKNDAALGLDELLNVSELDDDEADVKIWQDFNQRAKVPLGAFRNKLAGPTLPIFNESLRQKVYKKSKPKPKVKQSSHRKALISEAMQEGYRSTKLGLFAEHILGDVEEVMGDDREFMNLIKGL